MWLALRNWNLIIQASIIFSSCNQNKVILKPVSYSQFELFVNETNYVTDAEKYGWSIVQTDVYNFKEVTNSTWRKPDGELMIL